MKILKYGVNDCFFTYKIEKNKCIIKKDIDLDNSRLLISKEFSVMNYNSGKSIVLTIGKIVYLKKFNLRDNLYMITLSPDATSGYLISEDEIKYYTIPIHDRHLWIYIFKETKKFYVRKKIDLFSFGEDIGDEKDIKPYIFQHIKLICMVKNLIQFEDKLVLDKFINNVLNILEESRKMIRNHNLLDEEKFSLMEETKKLMTKLYNTIISISPLDTSKVVTSYALLDKYAKQDDENQKKIEEEKQKLKTEMETFKKNYLSTIKCKSSLIDDFNS